MHPLPQVLLLPPPPVRARGLGRQVQVRRELEGHVGEARMGETPKRNEKCTERNPKVSTTTRACLSQTGAGWWLTPFGAPDCALRSGVRTEVHLDGRGAPWGASVYFPVASC